MTPVELREMMHYDPITGIFTWLIPPTNSTYKVNDVVGFLDKGYLRVWIGSSYYRLHRLAFLYITGRSPEVHIEHRNHRGTDNRWENLREVSQKEIDKDEAIKLRKEAEVEYGFHENHGK